MNVIQPVDAADPTALLTRIRQAALPAGALDTEEVGLRQQGEMRFTPNGRWLPFTAEQRFFGPGVEFRWQARVAIAPLVKAQVVDAFENGRGCLRARLYGVLPIARAAGPATDLGEALRGLAELPWRPWALRPSPWLHWEAVAEGRLRAEYRDGKTQAAIEFEVAADGQILGAFTPGRPRIVGQAVVPTPWSGVFRDYRRLDRVLVPTFAEAVWHLPEGPFPYWRGRVLEYRLGRS